jgi:hypothetical protein
MALLRKREITCRREALGPGYRIPRQMFTHDLLERKSILITGGGTGHDAPQSLAGCANLQNPKAAVFDRKAGGAQLPWC